MSKLLSSLKGGKQLASVGKQVNSSIDVYQDATLCGFFWKKQRAWLAGGGLFSAILLSGSSTMSIYCFYAKNQYTPPTHMYPRVLS